MKATVQEEQRTDIRQSKRYRRGLARLGALDPNAVAMLETALAGVAPDMVDHTVAFAYGDVYDGSKLDRPARQLVTVAALAALGNAVPQLRFHINAALNVGIRPEEVIEVLYLTMIFAGFPACLNAVAVAREVFEERGLVVTPPAQTDGNRRDKGLAALRATSQTSGSDVIAGLKDIAPEFGEFILDFSYGDVISRSGISPQWKECAMIAAAAARGTMAPQLAVHLHAALNTGCSREEIAEVLMQIGVYAGFPAALNAISVYREILEERGEQNR